MVFLPKHCLHRIILMREVSLESWAEIDVPAPEAAEERFWILVVIRSEFAVFAGVLCHGISVYNHKVILTRNPFSCTRSR